MSQAGTSSVTIMVNRVEYLRLVNDAVVATSKAEHYKAEATRLEGEKCDEIQITPPPQVVNQGVEVGLAIPIGLVLLLLGATLGAALGNNLGN